MHHTQSTNPRRVHQLAAAVLTTALNIRAVRAVPAPLLADLLLRMAATTRTLFALARRTEFSHETIRKAVRSLVSTEPRLAEQITDALHALVILPLSEWGRPWIVAIDTHYVPFYGRKTTPGIVGGAKKQGTNHFFCYATATILHARRRYTIGFLPVGPELKPLDIVRALLEQVAKRNLLVGGVALDAGFSSGETILLLQERKLSYVVRLPRKGAGSNRRNDCFVLPTGTVRGIEWTTEKSRKKVSTQVVVWRERGESESRVFAFGGAWDPKTARKWYAARFGIETSYRQKNQCRAWTTGVSGAYRLLLEGIAHVIRQVWVYLTSELETVRRWVSQLPFADLLEWLATESCVGHWPEIPLGKADASPEGS